jgi:CBS domain-containing protein
VAGEMVRRGVGHALVVEGSYLKGIATERDIIYGLIVRGE